MSQSTIEQRDSAQPSLNAELAPQTSNGADDANASKVEGHVEGDSKTNQGVTDAEKRGDDQHQAHDQANFFDSSQYQQYFPQSSNAAQHAFPASFPQSQGPHPQHPHLGVEALGHAAAASQHAGRVAVPNVSAPEGDGGNVSVSGFPSEGDTSMDLSGTSFADTTANSSAMESPGGTRSGGGKARSSLAPPELQKETPYSRSPELRFSHKLAERKRRKEMKDLFDDLREHLPLDKGPKTSKWEILHKAVAAINELKQERGHLLAQIHALRGEGPPPEHDTQGDQSHQGTHQQSGVDGADDSYKHYEQQQVASQQQLEAAAAAAAAASANQFAQGQSGYDNQEQDQDDQQPPPPAPVPEGQQQGAQRGGQGDQQGDGQTNEQVMRDWSSITSAAAAT